MKNILHVMAGILNSRLGSRARFQSLVEQSRFSHRMLSTYWPGTADHAIRREIGHNWEIDALWGQSWLAARGAFFLTWPILRTQIGMAAKHCNARIIQGHNTSLLSLAAADLAYWLGLPFIFETHGLSGTASSVGKSVSQKIRRIERRLIQHADRVIVQTLAMKKSVVNLYGTAEEKIFVLSNFVDAERFDPRHWQNERWQLRQEWGVIEGERVFLYPGFINWYNGIPELLEAFAGAHFAQPARLVICGDGDLVARVREAENTSPNPISYKGVIDREHMPGVYAAADCLVLPRPNVPETREATPMKLLEAMVMEKLVLCSRVDGMTEVADDRTAVLVKPGDMVDLRQHLESITNDFPNYTHFVKNARAKVTRMFTVTAASKKLDLLYQELV